MRTTIHRLLVGVAISAAIFGFAPRPTAAAGVWHGVAGANDPFIRSAPSGIAPIVGTLHSGDPVEVIAFVQGARLSGTNETWAELAPGQYVYSAMLLKPMPAEPPPAPTTFPGRWIDANLTEQILTAYDGSTPLFWTVMSSGAPGTDSPTGVHTILRRVANETMSSSTLAFKVAIPYYIPNVLDTQYFTDYGAAIHGNYWKGVDSPFGIPTSHACLGIRESDALHFWNFATVGTVINLHF